MNIKYADSGIFNIEKRRCRQRKWEAKLKDLLCKNRKQQIIIICIILLIGITFFSGVSIGKAVHNTSIKSNTEIAKPILEVEKASEIIITEERINHIKMRHPEDYSLFNIYGAICVKDPDYIIKDGKHDGTIFMVKKLEDTNLNVVVRIALETDDKGIMNSVMTFYRIRERNLIKLIRKNSSLAGKDALLYKKE